MAQECLRGGSVRTLERVAFTQRLGAALIETELARDRSLAPLTAIGVPDGAAIDLRSRNGNWTHLYSGALWRAPAITASGEIVALDRGHGQFSVAASLGYFAVVLPRFLARVKGTIFDVDFEPAAAAFSVSEGTVAVTRTVAIRLRDENRTVDGIRFTDIIAAGGKSSVTYRLPLGIGREYANQQDAENALTAQLRDAIAGGDPQAVDDAISNLQIVTGKTVAGFAHGIRGERASAPAARGSSPNTAVFAGAAVAAVSVFALANAPPQSRPATPGPGPTPGATPTPTSSPTLSPTPTASPSSTASPGSTQSPIPSPSPTPAASPTPTASPVPTASPTASPVPTASPTATPSPSPTPIPTPVPTPTPTPSPVSGGVGLSGIHREIPRPLVVPHRERL